MHVNCRFRVAVVVCVASMFLAPAVSSEELSLQQALDLARQCNPTIAASKLSAQAAGQSAKGAQSLTNPEVLIAPSVVGDAGSDSAILLTQPLELNGSRRVRGEIASSEATAASFDADTIRKDVMLQVSQSYWDVAQAQELVKLNQDNVAYLDAVRAAVQKQYDVGAVPGAQVMKMEVEQARARQELIQAELELSQSKAALNALLNRPCPAEFCVSDSLKFSDLILCEDTLKKSAIARRPEVGSAQSQLITAMRQISAARLKTIPDIALQARKGSFDAGSDGGIALVLSLPVLDWGSAGADRRSAATSAKSREKQLEAVRNNIFLDVEKAIQQVNSAARIVREYQSGILNKSEQLAEMAKKGYEKGANSYLELLEAQRTLRNTRSDYYDALAEHTKALAKLEWAVGCPLTEANQ